MPAMLEQWVVYLLEVSDGSYYCGATSDIARRFARHSSGRGSKYVRSRLPATVVAVSGPMSRSAALKAELQIKRLHRSKKLEAVSKLGS